MARASTRRKPQSPSWQVLSETEHLITAALPTAEWIALPGHPRERNIERHAHAKHWRLAAQAQGPAAEALRHVFAAVLKGRYYKVDGHTRAYLWESGGLPAPERVHVTIYKVESREALNALYETFDTLSAAHTKSDQVYGAYREHGLMLESWRLKGGHISDALNLVLRNRTARQQRAKGIEALDLNRAVGVFQEELRQLDSIKPEADTFKSSVIAAALLMLGLYPQPSTLSFFEKLSKGDGSKKNGLMDPVEAVLSCLREQKLQRQTRDAGAQHDLFARTVRAVLAWNNQGEEKNQFWFRNAIHRAKPEPLIAELKQKKGIEDDPRL